MIGPRPHDLLRIASVTRLCRDGPAWLTPALREAPWVVVRRARCAAGHVAVGIRGPERSRRYAAVIAVDMITEILSPPDLVERVDRLPDLPATHALRRVGDLLTGSGLRWGPAGSVGFTMATGVSAVTASSDLDLVLTLQDIPPLTMLSDLREAFRLLPARVDCQLDLPAGGVALDDLVGTADRVLVRTADGPSLMRVDQLAS
jgi:phosphoribosyl-dephospho-CoA transferase